LQQIKDDEDAELDVVMAKADTPVVKARPGDSYQIELKICGRWRMVSWVHLPGKKVDDFDTEIPSRANYYVTGTWNQWVCEKMEPVAEKPGLFRLEVQFLCDGGEFQIIRERDFHQQIYPEPASTRSQDSACFGPDDLGSGVNWVIGGKRGDVYTIEFSRYRKGADDVKKVCWNFVDQRELTSEQIRKAKLPRYTIVGTWDNFREARTMMFTGQFFCFYVEIGANHGEEFLIWQDGNETQAIYPSVAKATADVSHVLVGPCKNNDDFRWSISPTMSDEPKLGSRYEIKLMVTKEGNPTKLVWSKLGVTDALPQEVKDNYYLVGR